MGEIIICGASVRSLAQSAVRAGFTPLCADFFADSDLLQLLQQSGGRMVGRIRSFVDLPAIIHSLPPNTPMVWAGGLENHPEVLACLARRHTLAGASPEIVANVRDPFRLSAAMKAAGVRFPLTIQNRAGRVHDCAAGIRTRWLLKQRNSAGGMGITSIAAEDRIPETTENDYLQQFVDGVAISAMFTAEDSYCEMIGVSLQLTGLSGLRASGFRYCGNMGPLQVSAAVERQIQIAGTAVSNWCGLRGIFGADFILQRGTVWLLEVNPRITASHELYEIAQGRNLLLEHLNCFRGDRHRGAEHGIAGVGRQPPGPLPPGQEPVEKRPGSPACVLKMIVYSDRSFVVPDETVRANPCSDATTTEPAADRALIPPDKRHAWPRVWVADLPLPGTRIEAGGPICTVYVSGHSPMEILQFCSADRLISEPWQRERPGLNIPDAAPSFHRISRNLNQLLDLVSRHLHQ